MYIFVSLILFEQTADHIVIYYNKYSSSNNFKSFKWDGLFYHKRKVHNCTDVHSRRYELELELKSSSKACEKRSTRMHTLF